MGKIYERSVKRERAITLIALVITIIVLLILAGVAIATLTGENGILTQANKAKTETDNANIEEQVKLAFLGSYGTDGKLDYSQLAKNLEKIEEMEGIPDTITEGSFPLTVTVDKEEIKIFDDSTIFNSGEWDKTATDEDCFVWGSDVEGQEGYDVIIGYTEKLESYSKARIPSRCKRIICDGSYYSSQQYSDEQIGRAFFSNIEKIEIPNTVVEIGTYAFGNIHGAATNVNISLKEIEIPNSVVAIRYGAFAYCTNVTELTIPDSVVTIESIGGWLRPFFRMDFISDNKYTRIYNYTFWVV